jgi:hypothetical protein
MRARAAATSTAAPMGAIGPARARSLQASPPASAADALRSRGNVRALTGYPGNCWSSILGSVWFRGMKTRGRGRLDTMERSCW